MNEQKIRAKYGKGADDENAVSVETENLMVNFAYDHLPEKLQGFSQQCYDLAANMVHDLRDTEELRVGLRKLLEAKDCFVRAAAQDGVKV